MLACVLYEPDHRNTFSPASKQAAMPNPTLTLDHSSPTGDSHDRSQIISPLSSIPKDSTVLSTSHSSGCSSSDPYHGENTPPLNSTGTTPPTALHQNAYGARRRSQLQPVSLAGSPDQHSNSRSSTNFGTTLASSLSRSFTFGHSSSPSPPGNSTKKRSSPAGSLNATGSTGWTGTGAFGKPASAVPDYLTASTTVTSRTHSDTESERQGSSKVKSNGHPRVVLKNQDAFDSGHGYAYVPLLDPKQEQRYKAYRAAYADLLCIWGMPVQQREMLRIDAITEDRIGVHRSRQFDRRSSTLIRPDSRVPMIVATQQHSQSHYDKDYLGLQRHCGNCGYSLAISAFSHSSTEKVTRNGGQTSNQGVDCPQCKQAQPVSAKPFCVVCDEVVQGMFIPCLSCGHICCLNCHSQWFSFGPSQNRRAEDSSGSTPEAPSCPTGCGCQCSEHDVVEVPMPPPRRDRSPPNGQSSKDSRSRSRRRGPFNRSSAGQSSTGRHNQNGEAHYERWPTSSFAQLARGLGSGLTLDLPQKKNVRRSGNGSSAGWPGIRTTLERVDTM